MAEECFAGLQPHMSDIVINGVRIHYYVWGMGSRDVVMIHGITSSALSWWRVAPRLARAGYRVIALDMPGHGDSARPDISYAVDEAARLVDAWMAALGLDAPTVVGHSWGGSVTLSQATDPHRKVSPRSLLLVDPLLRTRASQGYQFRDALLKLLGRPRRELIPILRKAYPRWHTCDIHWKAEALEKAAPSALKGVFADNAGLELTSHLQATPAPWCLMVADPSLGGILPQALWPDLEEAARTSTGVVRYLPGVSHDIHREDFDGFIVIVSEFLHQGS